MEVDSRGRGVFNMSSEFRALLVRRVDRAESRTLCICMQNPSRAAADPGGANDPTILRLVGFTKRLGFGRLVVVNTYLYRATDPRDLYAWIGTQSPADLLKHREWAFESAYYEACRADCFVAAWGNGDQTDRWPSDMAKRLSTSGVPLHVFGFNKNGTPKHPLARGRNRIPDDQQLIPWIL
jgi:hypothetical protein